MHAKETWSPSRLNLWSLMWICFLLKFYICGIVWVLCQYWLEHRFPGLPRKYLLLRTSSLAAETGQALLMSLYVLIKEKDPRDINHNIIDMYKVNNGRGRIQFQQCVCFNEEVVSREEARPAVHLTGWWARSLQQLDIEVFQVLLAVCACVYVCLCKHVCTAFCLSPNLPGFQGGRAVLWCSQVARLASLTIPYHPQLGVSLLLPWSQIWQPQLSPLLQR